MSRPLIPGEKLARDAWCNAVRNKRPVLRAAGERETLLGLECHHVVPKQKLRRVATEQRVGLDAEVALLWDVRNGIPVSGRRHDRHHSYHERITRAELEEHFPDVLEFVEEYGLEAWFDRFYPERKET